MIIRRRLTEASLAWLQTHAISTHYRGERRLKAGEVAAFEADVEIEPYVGVYAGETLCEMGFLSFTNSPVPADASIGRYCSLGPDIRFGGTRHPIEHVSTSVFTHAPGIDIVQRFVADHDPAYDDFLPNPQRPAARLGHDVWVGAGAVLMNGVSIGTGAVIAAHSVVTRDVEPYAIVGGNPARLMRRRFADEVVADLLALEWWRYRFTDFKGLAIGDPARFVEQLRERAAALRPYEPEKLRLADMPGEAVS